MNDAELARMLDPWVLLWVAGFGACVGSFLNVVVFRLPRKCLSVFKPARSFCPKCRHAIRWYENLPIVSWALILRARCAGCGLPISMRYPLVEAATMILFLLGAWVHLKGHPLEPRAWAAMLVVGGFGSALLCCALIDWDLRIVPDLISVPGILIGPFALALAPTLLGANALPDLEALAAGGVLKLESSFAWWGISGALGPLESLATYLGDLARHSPETYLSLQGFCFGVFGATVGGAGMWAFSALLSPLARRYVGREALGFGDVKLSAMIGAFCGWKGLLVALLIASLVGSAIGILLQARKSETESRLKDLPFAPFLALGGLAACLGGQRLLQALAS